MVPCAKQDALRSFSEGGPVYYVYLIECLSARRERYVEMTTDLKRRFREHNEGKSFHTTKFGPWKLVSYIAFTDRARQKLSNAISNPVQVTHSLENAYGNLLLEVFRVLFCSTL